MKTISVVELNKKLASGDVQLIDVRESFEYSMMRIPGARHIPLRSVAARLDEIDLGSPVYVVCRSGSRSASAAQIIVRSAGADVINVTGGVLEWNRHGFAVEKTERTPWTSERRIRLAAGLLILAAVVLSLTASSWFMLLAGVVGLVLLFLAATKS
jgi:rhodanese-related sulfurtransferase